MTTRIRRWIETDTGHRVPNHKSKCCHLHGHRYRWEAEIEGDVVEVEGVSGGDSVKVIMNGDGELKKIFLSDSLLKESKEIIEDLIVAAHNKAKSKLKEKTSEEIAKVTGGMSLPPGFKLPF